MSMIRLWPSFEGEGMNDKEDREALSRDYIKLDQRATRLDAENALLKAERDTNQELLILRNKQVDELHQELRKADCGASSPEPCRLDPPCLCCYALKLDIEVERLREEHGKTRNADAITLTDYRDRTHAAEARAERAEAALRDERDRLVLMWAVRRIREAKEGRP